MKSPDIQYSCSDKCCMLFTAVVLFSEGDFIPLCTLANYEKTKTTRK